MAKSVFTKEQIKAHNIIMNNYRRNPEILNFINNFFTTRRGLRPMVIHRRNGVPGKSTPPIRYYPANTKNMLQFKDYNINSLNTLIGQIHFLICIYSENIKNKGVISSITSEANKLPPQSNKEHLFKPHIIGISPCIEIDIKPTSIFKNYKQAMYLKCLMEDSIEDMGFKSNSMFSGNGIYSIIESYYFDEREDNFYDMKTAIESFKKELNNKMTKKYKHHKAEIDEHSITWSIYYKAPFTYHNKWNRISIPLKKGEINSKWLNEISDLDKPINFKEIIQEAKWENIW